MPDTESHGEPTLAEVSAAVEGVAIRLADIAGRLAALDAEVSKHSRVLARVMAVIREGLDL